ncbi:uncharacterized protein LOC107648292 isoform X1 [Arachis ipaensis]|uniref:uncharacterized protein LOC107648292 isoform X1 n=1 Tax=Arachis ipaensis TaxID=130454 RepID=UPI0007AEF9CA|nr:uncharacterized protein LOC107648292 isoform X1 [Arachis ipaensis]XP_025658055.1 uncharacterized protein LOC112754586 isoform X1 [Arachis hypogaea]QHN86467.1 uncharacterized protein DS421_16g546550 [Arachis hypogaea]
MSLPSKCLCCNVASLTLSSLSPLPPPPAPAVCTSTYYHNPAPLIHKSPFQQVDHLTTRGKEKPWSRRRKRRLRLRPLSASVPAPPPLDLTEDNVRQVLVDARAELGQIFDTSVGITGTVELAELDGPFVKISLKGRFWHKRSDVVARVANYLKQRIPPRTRAKHVPYLDFQEILEVDIEDEKQLDDSPENF